MILIPYLILATVSVLSILVPSLKNFQSKNRMRDVVSANICCHVILSRCSYGDFCDFLTGFSVLTLGPWGEQLSGERSERAAQRTPADCTMGPERPIRRGTKTTGARKTHGRNLLGARDVELDMCSSWLSYGAQGLDAARRGWLTQDVVVSGRLVCDRQGSRERGKWRSKGESMIGCRGRHLTPQSCRSIKNGLMEGSFESVEDRGGGEGWKYGGSHNHATLGSASCL